MLTTYLSTAGATPYLPLLAAVAVHARPLILLAGFLAALRGTRGPKRGDLFTVFARHLAPQRRPRR